MLLIFPVHEVNPVTFVVDAGADKGVSVDRHLSVYTSGEVIMDPDTDQKLARLKLTKEHYAKTRPAPSSYVKNRLKMLIYCPSRRGSPLPSSRRTPLAGVFAGNSLPRRGQGASGRGYGRLSREARISRL